MDDYGPALERAAASLGFAFVEMPAADAASVESAVGFLVGRLVGGGLLAAEHAAEAARAVLRRERVGSTAVGGETALPHATTPTVNRFVGLLAHCPAGVPWQSLDGLPVRRVCLVLAPPGHPGDYLRLLERVAQALRQTGRSEP